MAETFTKVELDAMAWEQWLKFVARIYRQGGMLLATDAAEWQSFMVWQAERKAVA